MLHPRISGRQKEGGGRRRKERGKKMGEGEMGEGREGGRVGGRVGRR